MICIVCVGSPWSFCCECNWQRYWKDCVNVHIGLSHCCLHILLLVAYIITTITYFYLEFVEQHLGTSKSPYRSFFFPLSVMFLLQLWKADWSDLNTCMNCYVNVLYSLARQLYHTCTWSYLIFVFFTIQLASVYTEVHNTLNKIYRNISVNLVWDVVINTKQ